MPGDEDDEHVLYQLYNNHCPETATWESLCLFRAPSPPSPPSPPIPPPHPPIPPSPSPPPPACCFFAHRAGTDDDSWNPTQMCWYAANEYQTCRGLSSSTEEEMNQNYRDGCPVDGPSFYTSLCIFSPPPPTPPAPPPPSPATPEQCCYRSHAAGMADSGWTQIQKCYFAAMEYNDCMPGDENDEHVLYQLYNNHCPETATYESLCLFRAPYPPSPPSPPIPPPHPPIPPSPSPPPPACCFFAHRAGTDDDSWDSTEKCYHAATEYKNCRGLSPSTEEEMNQDYRDGCPVDGPSFYTSLCIFDPPPPEPPPPPSPPPRVPGACCYAGRQAGTANSGWNSDQQCSYAAIGYIECMDFSASSESERTEIYNNGCAPEKTYWVSLCLTVSPPPEPPPPPSPPPRAPGACCYSARQAGLATRVGAQLNNAPMQQSDTSNAWIFPQAARVNEQKCTTTVALQKILIGSVSV